MLSCQFAGKDSCVDYGLLITKRPTLPSPKRRVTYIDIPGRDSSLRYDENTYEDITIAVECTLKGSNLFEQIDLIKGWLFSAEESDLIFSFQKDKKYKAQVVNNIDFAQTFKVISQFVIVFNCRPFKYEVSNESIIISSGLGTSLLNEGTITSRPITRVYCTGNGSFKINNLEVSLSNVNVPFITIDSEVEEAYTIIDGVISNANNLVYGEFPILEVGNNIITYTGGITRIEITPNWRWL